MIVKLIVMVCIFQLSGCAAIDRINRERDLEDCMSVCFSKPRGGVGYSDTEERTKCGCL